MAVQIQLRNDTAANWTAENPILAVGEVGVETSTGQVKVGDGTTAWNSLGYFGISSAYVDNAVAGIVDSAPSTLDTLNELAAALGDDANFATTVTSSLALKANSVGATLTSPVLTSAFETATVSATAATGTVAVDIKTSTVKYFTANASANWTFNFRGNSSTTLDSMLAAGQSATVAFLVTNGATAYRPTAFQIDGSAVTPKWQGGTAPSTGNASSIDSYVFTILKTGTATFTVFASQTKFA
jgi:hypothetical protein